MRKLLVLILAVILCSCCTTSKYAPERSNDTRALMNYLTARTVLVERSCPSDSGLYSASGSGVIIDSVPGRSRVVTAAHVVDARCTTTVTRGEGEPFDAVILIEDEKADLAVLSVEANFRVDTKYELYPYIGQPVLAVGYPVQFRDPYGEYLSVTEGVVATLNLPAKKGKLIRITTVINYGSSGGPLFSREGKLVGINVSMSAIAVPGSLPVPRPGYYYAKPAAEVLALLETLDAVGE